MDARELTLGPGDTASRERQVPSEPPSGGFVRSMVKRAENQRLQFSLRHSNSMIFTPICTLKSHDSHLGGQEHLPEMKIV